MVWLECLCYWYYCYFSIVNNLAMFLFLLSLQGVLLLGLLPSIIDLFSKVTAYISIILVIIE